MDSGDDDLDQVKDGVTIDVRRYLLRLLRHGWWIAGFVALAVAGAVLYTARQVPIFEASASVQIEPKLPDLLGTGDLFNVVASGGGAEYYRQQQVVIASYTLCQQTVVANDLIPKLLDAHERASRSQADQLELASQRLMGMIKVRYPDEDRIMYVTVRSPNAALARDLANFQVATYVSYAKGLLSQNSSDASNALQAEFNEAEKKLRDAEDKIYKFQADNDMIAMTLEEQQSLVASNILAFSTKLNDATGDELKLAAKLAQMKKESGANVLSSPISMMGDDAMSFDTLRAEYYTEHNHLLELEKDLGPKNSEYLAQKQKVDDLFKALQSALQMVIDGNQDLYLAQEETIKGLNAELDKYKKAASALSPKIVVYNDLMRNKRGIEDEYSILRTRLAATQMTNGVSSSISNVRPLDPALLPTKPVSPKIRNNIVIAAFLALILAVGFVCLIVFLDRTIKGTTDAVTAGGLPVLGLIPALASSELTKDDDRSRDMFVHDHPTSHIAECCRSLRTNIMLSTTDRPAKTIVVCSANKGEGKTTSVIYLGTIMAQSNQRVLLIDTDMRRPRLHMAMNVERQPGLTNLIVGEDVYDEVIKQTDVPNLYVLPCGALPPNPAELLMSQRFETVLAELGKRFDRIILDSPPLPYTDAVVLSKLTDGVILVVRANKTLRDELKRSVRTFHEVDGPTLGVIVNELDRREGDASYYYYSYYGYGQKSRDGADAA